MEGDATSNSLRGEREIERLVGEIDQVIQREEPDQRRELRAFASALIADISTEVPASSLQAVSTAERRPFGVLAAGLALLLVGGGLFLVIPPIGMTLFALGIVLVIWGAIAGWWRASREEA